MTPQQASVEIANAAWFNTEGVRAVFSCLNQDGEEARLVGGTIRNALLALPVNDIDFATTALPDKVLSLAKHRGIKAIPTGIAHGTITLIVNAVPFEVTTLRRDIDTDGRHATVRFGRDWTEDAKRRDFTINAFYANATGCLYDPLGGLDDLECRKVRFIGEPRYRICEDYLRILRFFRFSARYAEGDFDGDGLLACSFEREGLRKLSPERIRKELFEILVAKRSVDAIKAMDQTGVNAILFEAPINIERFTKLVQLEDDIGFIPNPILRLTALLPHFQFDIESLKDRFRLSSAEAIEIETIVNGATAIGNGVAYKELYRLGARAFIQQTLLLAASKDRNITTDKLQDVIEFARSWVRPHFPINGLDLVALGFTRDVFLGSTLKELEALWIDSEFKTTRDDIIQAAKAKLSNRLAQLDGLNRE